MTNTMFQNIISLNNTLHNVNSRGIVEMTIGSIQNEVGRVTAVRVNFSTKNDFDYHTFMDYELDSMSWDSVCGIISPIIERLESEAE